MLAAMTVAASSATVPPLLAARADTWRSIAVQRSIDLANRTDAERGLGDCRPYLVTSRWLRADPEPEECGPSNDWPFERELNGEFGVQWGGRDPSSCLCDTGAPVAWREAMLGPHLLVRWRVTPCPACWGRLEEPADLVVGLPGTDLWWWVTVTDARLDHLERLLRAMVGRVAYLTGSPDCAMRAAWAVASPGAGDGASAPALASYGVPELAERVRADLVEGDARATRWSSGATP